MMKKNIVIYTLLLSGMLSNSVIFAAPVSFTDVSYQHPCATGIEYCAENKIVNGIGNGLFLPNKPIDRYSMAAMLLRTYEPELTKKKIDPIKEAAKRGYFDYCGMPQTQNKQCRWATILNLILEKEGLPVYPADLWSSNSGMSDLYCSAQKYGLINGLESSAKNMNAVPTRGQLALLIFNAKTKLNKAAKPIIAKQFPVRNDGGSNQDLITVFEAANHLPAKMIHDFKEQGWKLIIYNGNINQYHEQYKDLIGAQGIADAKNKEILLETTGLAFGSFSEKTFVHEMGHFCEYTYDEFKGFHPTDDFRPLWNKEKNALSKVIRPYAATDSSEGFADLMAEIYSRRNNPKQLNALKKAVPLCYQYEVDFLRALNSK